MTANTSPDQGQSRSPSEHSEAELLPCPFCGSCDVHTGHGSSFYVHCRNCDVEGPWNDESESDAIAAWNRRAAPAEAGERTLPSIDTLHFEAYLMSYDTQSRLWDANPESNGDDFRQARKGLVDFINAYGQQCARYAVEEYKRKQAALQELADQGQEIGVGYESGAAHHTDKGD